MDHLRFPHLFWGVKIRQVGVKADALGVYTPTSIRLKSLPSVARIGALLTICEARPTSHSWQFSPSFLPL